MFHIILGLVWAGLPSGPISNSNFRKNSPTLPFPFYTSPFLQTPSLPFSHSFILVFQTSTSSLQLSIPFSLLFSFYDSYFPALKKTSLRRPFLCSRFICHDKSSLTVAAVSVHQPFCQSAKQQAALAGSSNPISIKTNQGLSYIHPPQINATSLPCFS